MDNSNDQFEREASTRKQILFQHFQETRERFIRLLVLLRWSKKSKKTLDKFNQVSSAMDLKVNSFDMASFTLFHAARILSRLREPVFDLPTAIDVLTTGTYPRLPHIIQQSRGDLQNSADDFTTQDKERAISKLTDIIRMKLLQCTIPPNMFVNKLENGQVNLIAENEFSIIMTLNHKREEGESNTDELKYYWQIIYLDLLVNEDGINVSPIHDDIVQRLSTVIQKRLYYLDESDTMVPSMVDIYNIIHLVTIRIAMDIITKQAKTLKWPNEIVTCETFNESVDQDFSLSLKYWHKAPPMVSFIEKVMDGIEDDEKNFFLKDKGSRNELKIFIDKSKQIVFDMQPKLRCNYTPAINLSRINLGKIISDCIFYHSIERLESVKVFLNRERLFPDIQLITDAESNQAYLSISVFEEYILILGIDWKTGHFQLHLSVDGEKLDVDYSEFVTRINNIDVRKSKFSEQLLSSLEGARKRTIIHAYKTAGALLDLDVHSALFEGDGLSDENVYFSFPNVSTAFIQIRVTPFSYERRKPLVSSRVVIERSPKIIDIPIPSSLFLDIYQPAPEEEIDSYEPTQKRVKRMTCMTALQKTLVAFRHLKQIIAASKHKVLFGTMLRQVQISNRFSYDLTDQEYEMIILPNDNSNFSFLDLECITLSIDVNTYEWVATVYERRPLPVIIPQNSKQHYVNDRLTFKYTTMRNCQNLFEEFYQDLLSIDRMYPLALQVIHPSPHFAGILQQACTVEMVSHTKIRIDYGNCGYKLIIKNVDKRYRVILYPTNRFEADLEEYFNKHSRNDTYGEVMCKLVQLLLKSTVPLNKLKQFLSDRHPTSWYLIPRSMYSFKVVHKGKTTREFLVTCRASGQVEFKATDDSFHVISAPFGEEIDNAVLSLKRCCTSSTLLENMSPPLQIALSAENIKQQDNTLSFSSPTYEYSCEFNNYELKLTKIVPRKNSILTKDEEEFLKEAFTKYYLNSALEAGVSLSGNFFSHSFLLILFFPNPLFKHVVQAWYLLKDKIDLVFFNPYPVRNAQRRTYDESFGLAEVKLPTSLSALLPVFSSGKIIEKKTLNSVYVITLLVRVYIGDDFIDLPIQYGANMELKFGDQKLTSEVATKIIGESQRQEVPEEGSDNTLLKLLTYITANCTIPQLLDI
ncbi:predicted protein [Naegleria gruberi]|uniref:Mediator of RNA polymerase II transcription subunit 14 n=1 Tax=Naegleria gruberi TaxID=5762 RepID=D2V863_NAEGR|nr:uncharacterized protein NAEGRDRAFT_65043 [Naegleria gruberi]EFC46992.1 predicted protein [Naegleria gruberi]|eukprot:XP_002679736.1 predicted protein [Naegleria gruberi strain NEG-M]